MKIEILIIKFLSITITDLLEQILLNLMENTKQVLFVLGSKGEYWLVDESLLGYMES